MSDTTKPQETIPMQRVSFASSFVTLGNPKLEHLFNASKAFAESVSLEKKTGRFLTLSGPSGCGKTHLSKEIGISVQRTNPKKLDRNGLFHPWQINFWKLHKLIKKCRAGDFSYLAMLKADDFSILDDLGAAYGSEFSTSIYQEIIEARIGKWTVITTNMTFEEIGDQLDQRIASRLIREGGQFVEISGVHDFGAR